MVCDHADHGVEGKIEKSETTGLYTGRIGQGKLKCFGIRLPEYTISLLIS